MSVGALVALAMRSQHAGHLVLVEPPLRTGRVWPFRKLALTPPPGAEAFLWNVLGVSQTAQEDRDYSALLDGLTCPALALVGAEPLLPERPFTIMPSLLDKMISHTRIFDWD